MTEKEFLRKVRTYRSSYPSLRYGQAVSNLSHIYRKVLGEGLVSLAHSLHDPFYFDDRVPNFLRVIFRGGV